MVFSNSSRSFRVSFNRDRRRNRSLCSLDSMAVPNGIGSFGFREIESAQKGSEGLDGRIGGTWSATLIRLIIYQGFQPIQRDSQPDPLGQIN
jgi:hypothetical protein